MNEHMHIQDRDATTSVLHIKFTYNAQKFHWSHTCRPVESKTAHEVAKDVRVNVERRVAHIRNGDLVPPAEAIATRDAFRTFIITGTNQQLPAKASELTIQKLVDMYLAARRLEYETSEDGQGISLTSYDTDRRRLDQFLEFCKREGKSLLSSVLTAEFLDSYRQEQLEQVAERKRRGKPKGTSAANAHHRLRVVKALLIWADKKEKIDRIPKNVKDGEYAKIPQPKPQPKFFSVKDIEHLYTAADEQQRLWILLGLNCGFTQNDIATLTHDMVDWDKSIIKRDRQKTGVDSQHKLWPITLRELKAQRTNPAKSSLLLLNKYGNPLVQHVLKDDGKASINDTIVQSFRRLAKKAKVSGTFKILRKTGADAIERQFQDKPHLPTLYLAHDLAGKIRTHYTRQSYDALHEATDWLAENFGLNDGGTLSQLGEANSQ